MPLLLWLLIFDDDKDVGAFARRKFWRADFNFATRENGGLE
jgi:hypothetical protein